MNTFEMLGVSSQIHQAIKEMGFENPMPVQQEVIPYLLGENNDIIALAQTGTGKTAAFGLPIVQKTDVDKRHPQSLILAPTRELCLQITKDLTQYAKYVKGLNIVAVYGGAPIEAQIKTIKRGVHIIVATPGRLIDLMHRKTVSLSTVTNVVLDEADEMLNMGFTESINEILAEVPKERNMLLFSATMSREIASIAKNYLNHPKEVTIGRRNESTSTVQHIAYTIQAKDKYATLKRIVDFNPTIYSIIFCRTRKETQEIADKLMKDGYDADCLHGELSQAQRDLVMQKFRLKHLQLLIATDVAARGLDVDHLTHIINYSLPEDTEIYTHRSGRTGRAGRTGISVALCNLREKGKLRRIEKIIGKQFQHEEVPTGRAICENQLIHIIDTIQQVEVNQEEIKDIIPLAYQKLEDLSKEELIQRVVSLQFNSLLDYYRNNNEIETAKDSGNRNNSETRSGRNNRAAETGYKRIFISLGKNDQFSPHSLLDLLNNNTKKRIDLGRIDIMRNFSFFEVEEAEAEFTVSILNKKRWNGNKITVEFAESKANEGEFSPKKKRKTNRTERGYTEARGPKRNKKGQWKKHFESVN